MVNKEVALLVADYTNKYKTQEEKDKILEAMRQNLLERNGKSSKYTGGYTQQGKSYDINTASFKELLEINGDMQPLNM
ncbi:MAG: hypothetical protein IJT90_00630 [Bacteroidaceae bacterium]|nr:hypothetical protein [Bacteroidaceae bacterium]